MLAKLYIKENFTEALVHRSLNWNAPIRIFIFDNRVEIHSPGTLPNGLSVEDILSGTSMPRNNFLFTNAIYLLPYTGAGSGIQRALENDIKISFSNNERLHEFLITIPRNGNQVERDPDTIHDISKGIPDTFEKNPDTFHDTSKGIPDTFEKNPDTFHDTQRIKLTNKQKDIINFCTIPRSSREILEKVGVSYHSKNIQTYITSLVNANYIEMTIPDKPFDKNQKYRKKQ